MSNIGKKPINFRSDTQIVVNSENFVEIYGSLGKLSLQVPKEFKIQLDLVHHQVSLIPNESTKKIKALWGLYRSLLSQAIIGVNQGYSIQLEIIGVGYRALLLDTNILSLKIGYNQDILVDIPSDIKITCLKPTVIMIEGLDKQKVHQVASEIRQLRKPDSYKGKGIRYSEEIVVLKEGKKK
uniref:Ribosomal protein L6 n=1 Tax=Jakoba bahamiensis TaxID=221721 RepID=M4Q9R8_9EUKA|nr:ribosomal protein L6 [Jakoba bahamiensis]AGH24162.1 ribosomal protein L6 [Jakoba bahamiensis]